MKGLMHNGRAGIIVKRAHACFTARSACAEGGSVQRGSPESADSGLMLIVGCVRCMYTASADFEL